MELHRCGRPVAGSSPAVTSNCGDVAQMDRAGESVSSPFVAQPIWDALQKLVAGVFVKRKRRK